MLKKILYITPNYPLPTMPERGAFVDALIRGWRKFGVTTEVIAPTSLALQLRQALTKKILLDLAADRVYRPSYVSLSCKTLFAWNTAAVGKYFFNRACESVANGINPDAIVGKFLLSGGVAAADLGKRLGIPAFADLGESRSFYDLDAWERRTAKNAISLLTGAYCVSERNANEINMLGLSSNRILVAPNEPDIALFHRMDKAACRRMLGFSNDDKVIVFVGHFIERKGPLRLLKALESLGPRFKGIFIGRGPQVPKGPAVLYAGPVVHAELPIWLNAADVFCLPTLAEGHCNAIEEAKACNLPIVSSEIPAIRNQLKNYPSILIDVLDPSELVGALREITTGGEMPSTSTMKNEIFCAPRAKTIIDWITLKIVG